MMKHVNHERLRQLRLYGMAKALEDLERLPDRGQLAAASWPSTSNWGR